MTGPIEDVELACAFHALDASAVRSEGKRNGIVRSDDAVRTKGVTMVVACGLGGSGPVVGSAAGLGDAAGRRALRLAEAPARNGVSATRRSASTPSDVLPRDARFPSRWTIGSDRRPVAHVGNVERG